MVEVYHPRYSDRKVLIGAWKWSRGYDMPLRIKYGAYKGEYIAPNKAIAEADVETVISKTGKELTMRAVPIDALVRTGDIP